MSQSLCEMFGLLPTKSNEEYDEKQLRTGITVELEHTNIIEVAQCIAKHHLDEYPDYYIHLKKMEKELGGK